jgi:hypothetical protein
MTIKRSEGIVLAADHCYLISRVQGSSLWAGTESRWKLTTREALHNMLAWLLCLFPSRWSSTSEQSRPARQHAVATSRCTMCTATERYPHDEC